MRRKHSKQCNQCSSTRHAAPDCPTRAQWKREDQERVAYIDDVLPDDSGPMGTGGAMEMFAELGEEQ